MANDKIRFTSPVGRIVSGSVDKAQDKDGDGKPLIIKSGPKIGQPTVKYYIGVAIPKEPGHTHWSQTLWGQQIWAVGHAAFPGIAQNPAFSWKVEDGDSQIPNTKGVKPCDREGYKGNWILHLSQAYAIPACDYKSTGKTPIDPKTVKRGYYVQVVITCQGNGQIQKPGVYLNPELVDLTAFGPEINSGPDADAAGFGKGIALPPGASLTPIGAMAAGPMAAPPPPLPGVAAPAAPPPFRAPTPLPGVAAPAPAAPALPNAAFLGVAPPAPAPVAPPPPPAAPTGPQMTAKAGGTTYEQFVANGWTPEALRANGYML